MTVLRSRLSVARWRRLVVSVPLAFLALTGAASAATFTVNDPTDSPLANPAGTTCVSAHGETCTLRAAVQAADNAGGSSTITLPTGDYELTVENPKASSEDEPATGDLDVKEGVELSIDGAGASSTTIDANHIDRAFAVHAKAALSIGGVTVENGTQNGEEPGDKSIDAGYGGAFYNDGSLSIEGSVLTGNSADDGGGVVYAGTEASATSIRSSTVTQNAADDDGGVLEVESGSVTLAGDQITHNSADDDGAVLYAYEHSGTVGAITVSGSTLDHNVGEEGGVLYLDDAGALSVSQSSLEHNVTYYDGSAVYDEESGAITISNSSVSDDGVAYYEGSAVYADRDGSLTASSSTFDHDASSYDGDGGALDMDETDLRVSASTFEGNQTEAGGAIYVDGTSATATQSITTSTFANNSAGDEEGGAIYDDYGDLAVSDSTFTGNSATYYGGALYYESRDGLSLINDTFDGNQSGEYGGALYFDTTASTGSIELLNDTIARNTAYYGGGIYAPDDADTIENTIVADNSGTKESTDGGGDCYYQAEAADKGGNLDSDGTCFGESEAAGDQIGVDPLLEPLASNGGPTETDALLPGSPAIGKAIGATCPTTDQRGVARSASACDVGAFQTVPADLSVAVAAPANTTRGDAIAYTITVTNNGPGPTGGVTLTEALPAGTSLYSINASQGSCSGTSTLTCALGALEDGASATVQVTAIANTTGSLTDTASVTSTETDPNPANNSTSATTLVREFPTSTTTTTTTTTTPTTAPTAKPQATTGKASEQTTTSLAFSGTINPEGSATTWRLAIGTSKKKLERLTVKQSAGSGTTPLGVLAIIKGLKPGTRYYVEIVAVNANGSSHGKIVELETKGKAPKKK